MTFSCDRLWEHIEWIWHHRLCMPERDPYNHHIVRDCPQATWTVYTGETPMTAILAGVPEGQLQHLAVCVRERDSRNYHNHVHDPGR